MDNTEQESVTKVYSEGQSMRPKVNASSRQTIQTPLLKSHVGASEPTRDPTVDLSSTQSYARGKTNEQSKPGSTQLNNKRINVGGNRIAPSNNQISRKRYFSIFDSNARDKIAATQPLINEESKDEGDSLVNSMVNGDGMNDNLSIVEPAKILKAKSFSKPVSVQEYHREESASIRSGERINRGMYLETLESVVDRYRPGRPILFNPKTELRDMISKASRRIVVRSFSTNSKSFERQTLDDKRPAKISLSIQAKGERKEPRNSLRMYEGHDSPIKKNVLQKQLAEFRKDHVNDHGSGVPMENTPVVRGSKKGTFGHMSIKASSRSQVDGVQSSGLDLKMNSLDSLEKDMITIQSSKHHRNPPSVQTLEKYQSTGQSDQGSVPSRRIREVRDFSVTPTEEGRPRGVTHSPGDLGFQNIEQEKSKHRRSHFSNLETRLGGIGTIAMRGLESLNARPSKPVQGNSPAATITNMDVNSPSFDIDRFKLLLFSKNNENSKQHRKFIKEIKLDLDVVKQIPQKEPCPAKVVLVDLDRSRT